MNEEPKYKGWRAIQLGDVAKHLAQYQPYLATLVAVVLITTLLPGARSTQSSLGGPVGTSPGPLAAASGPSNEIAGVTSTVSATIRPDAKGMGPAVAGGYSPFLARSRGCAAGDPYCDALAAPDCDRARGTIKIPTAVAPPCVPLFKGDNGGATWQGVTRDTVTVVAYIPQSNPQTDAALSAAGAGDTEDQIKQMFRDWAALFQSHFEMYGRKIKLVFVKARSDLSDGPAARADAVKIATEIKAFAVWTTAAPGEFAQELAARRVMVFPFYAWPAEFYTKLAPYMWSPGLMGASEELWHTAEYVGKRLWRRKAEFAGQLLQSQSRSFGLLHPQTGSEAGEKILDTFDRQWLGRYGARLTSRQGYVFDYSTIQTQAKTIMAKFQEQGVTSILLLTDFLSPVFFTEAATQQGYFPEWILLGALFTDANFYGRLYDQSQWSHAFGLSSLGVRLPKELNQVKDLYRWHFGAGKEVPAKSSYAILFMEQSLLFSGIHLAGPNLTPFTFREGLFSRSKPFSGAYQGWVITPGVSFGRAGGAFPWDDYVAYDDMAEIWWDPTEQGDDELGNRGAGMYQFSDGGRRYLPGQYPRSDSKAFDSNGAVAYFSQYPARERPPSYPHGHYRD